MTPAAVGPTVTAYCAACNFPRFGKISGKKRDEKVTSKSGKTTRYKLKFADRMNAPVSRRQELKDPKKNPKHTANK